MMMIQGDDSRLKTNETTSLKQNALQDAQTTLSNQLVTADLN